MIESSELIEIAEGNRRPQRLVSIVIPHFRTEELVRLCLRAIRYFTDLPYETIVVDNNSADGSLDYLRQVRWIRLIERGEEAGPVGGLAHGSAMDIGASSARGDYLLSFHTDTVVRKRGWLSELVSRLENTPRAAALGCGKLDMDSWFRRALKKVSDKHRAQRWLRRLFGLKENPRIRKRPFYPRSYCALYDLSVLRELNLSFMPDDIYTAGEKLYLDLLAHNHAGIRLEPREMARYVHHVSHATSHLIGRPHSRRRSARKINRALARMMGSDLACRLLDDESLDR